MEATNQHRGGICWRGGILKQRQQAHLQMSALTPKEGKDEARDAPSADVQDRQSSKRWPATDGPNECDKGMWERMERTCIAHGLTTLSADMRTVQRG